MSDVICGECGKPMELRNSQYGKFYGCTDFPNCRGTHGAHQETGEPLGIPGNQETKLARMEAHRSFDQWWLDKNIQRRGGYAKLKEHFGFEVHIGESDVAMCEAIVKFCNE